MSRLISRALTKKILQLCAAVVSSLSLLVSQWVAPAAYADQYSDQIKAIQSQVDSYNSQAAALKAQGDTLQNAIAVLAAQKSAIEEQISLTQVKHDDLVKKVDDTQKRMEAVRTILASTIADMYVNSKTTTLEMVASSSDISDFVNAQEYQNVAKDQMSSLMNQVKQLQSDLKKQQAGVDQTLSDQQAQQTALAQKTDEQQALLAKTQGDEAAYQAQITQGTAQINSLLAQQATANAAASKRYSASVGAGSSNHHGYPDSWSSAPQDSMVDSWGMYNRECVSYTAWRVDQAYGNMPYWGGRGNAIQWPSAARSAGIPTGTTPKVGSVAIMPVGSYGHAAWVESVNANGTVTVSQYNWGLRGEYSEMTINASAFTTYIYFADR